MSNFENPDYIVIGSGSAGSTIAYRLGENPQLKILVLEFGGNDKQPFYTNACSTLIPNEYE